MLITIGTGDNNSDMRTVSSRGMARWSRTLTGELGTAVTVSYALQDVTDPANPTALAGAPGITGGTSIVPVRHADDDSTLGATAITAVYDKEDRFRIAGALYSYDDDDTFINGITGHADVGKVRTLDQFEGLIKPGDNDTAGTVEVVFYDDDGVSIFRVTVAGS